MTAPTHPASTADGPGAAFALDRRALARAFNRAAGSYDAAAWLQQHARTELLERLDYFALQPHTVLDLGAGTCRGADELARRYPAARVLALDLAGNMLAAAPRRWWRRGHVHRLCGDAYALPLADHCVDVVYSSLMLQWSDRPDRVFVELARVLRPGGLLVFVSFGPDSLRELREAWAQADSGVHVSEFPDMVQIGSALMHAGFIEPVMDVEEQRRDYADARALMRELKQIGAHNAATARSRGLTGRGRMQAMLQAYERLRTPRGLPASFQLLFGAAFAAGVEAPPHGHRTAADGDYVVPLGQVRSRRGGRRTP
jgi:malonyl-CoA O-methyltransferase